MVGVDFGGRIDLERIIVLVGVLEEAVHGVEDLVRQLEEPLPRHASKVQPVFPSEDDEQSSAKFVRGQSHHLMERVVEQRLASHRDLDVARQCVAENKQQLSIGLLE